MSSLFLFFDSPKLSALENSIPSKQHTPFRLLVFQPHTPAWLKKGSPTYASSAAYFAKRRGNQQMQPGSRGVERHHSPDQPKRLAGPFGHSDASNGLFNGKADTSLIFLFFPCLLSFKDPDLQSPARFPLICSIAS